MGVLPIPVVANGNTGAGGVLGYEAVADGVGADRLVDALLEAVQEPGSGVRGAP